MVKPDKRRYLFRVGPPREIRDKWWNEMGFPRKEGQKYNEDIIYELSVIKETLAAIFNDNDPDHEPYNEWKVSGHQWGLWKNKVEGWLNILIDSSIISNSPQRDGMEYHD